MPTLLLSWSEEEYSGSNQKNLGDMFQVNMMFMKKIMISKYRGLLFVMCIVFPLAGCVQQHITLQSFLDTPKHHVSNGFKFLDYGHIDDAEREFKSALRLDKSFAQAYCGLALVAGTRGDFSHAFDSMETAKRYAKTPVDKARVAVAEMRLYTMERGKGWLRHVRSCFSDAMGNISDWPEAYYYLGIAYKQAYRFNDSAETFRKVKEMHSRLADQAGRELKTLKEIIRAMPGSPWGRRIAIKKFVTRADVAALLIEELRLDKIYENMSMRGRPLPGSSPQQRKPVAYAVPADVVKHPLRSDIVDALRLKVKGLECLSDGNFWPEQAVTRAEYAVIMGSIIATIRRDPTLSTRFSGKASPFFDVGNDEPFFNAVMLSTSETGVMEPKRGFFNPWEPVSGADAVLAVKKLKEELGVY